VTNRPTSQLTQPKPKQTKIPPHHKQHSEDTIYIHEFQFVGFYFLQLAQLIGLNLNTAGDLQGKRALIYYHKIINTLDLSPLFTQLNSLSWAEILRHAQLIRNNKANSGESFANKVILLSLARHAPTGFSFIILAKK